MTSCACTNYINYFSKPGLEAMLDREDDLVFFIEKSFVSLNRYELCDKIINYFDIFIRNFTHTSVTCLLTILRSRSLYFQGIMPHEAIIGNICRKCLFYLREAYAHNVSTTVIPIFETPLHEFDSDVYGTIITETLEALAKFRMEVTEVNPVAGRQSYQKTIIRQAVSVINNGDVIMTSGCSILVRNFLIQARDAGRQFEVIVAQREPFNDGRQLALELSSFAIKTLLIPQAAINIFISRATSVLFEPHFILMNGGCVSQSGTSILNLSAISHSIPVYALCERFQFSCKYPNNLDTLIPQCHPELIIPNRNGSDAFHELDTYTPMRDYIEPEYITFYLTTLGALRPEMIFRIVQQSYSSEDFDLTQ